MARVSLLQAASRQRFDGAGVAPWIEVTITLKSTIQPNSVNAQQ
jgi:hypothetical protein